MTNKTPSVTPDGAAPPLQEIARAQEQLRDRERAGPTLYRSNIDYEVALAKKRAEVEALRAAYRSAHEADDSEISRLLIAQAIVEG